MMVPNEPKRAPPRIAAALGAGRVRTTLRTKRTQTSAATHLRHARRLTSPDDVGCQTNPNHQRREARARRAPNESARGAMPTNPNCRHQGAPARGRRTSPHNARCQTNPNHRRREAPARRAPDESERRLMPNEPKRSPVQYFGTLGRQQRTKCGVLAPPWPGRHDGSAAQDRQSRPSDPWAASRPEPERLPRVPLGMQMMNRPSIRPQMVLGSHAQGG